VYRLLLARYCGHEGDGILRIRLTRARLVALIVVTALATAGLAVAVTDSVYTDASGAFSGCVTPSNGNLRLQTPGAACKASEIAVTWNEQGPRGERGAQGPQGIPGEKGDRGLQGPPGEGITSLNDLVGKPCTSKGVEGSMRLHESFSYSMTVLCQIRDPLEPNDTVETASRLEWGVRCCIQDRTAIADTPTIAPVGEVDWFVVRTENPAKGIYITGYSPALGKVRYDVF
jgi:hypothetical protein